ncbi:hypothetical protein Trco_002934 [Trichoderma cornu-damae]|uniref:Uncharacterized protein n=1 Tax=Trichoderma cornu-damae TaxID=654480 RepID=A0A9P8QUM7_9HYPO|nr:hypothetical protein Trco_002934 [Trichoderma cornu-damae]
MCDWEEFLFTCNHSQVRLKSYCHFARNDPNHGCLGVKVLRNSWRQEVPDPRWAYHTGAFNEWGPIAFW